MSEIVKKRITNKEVVPLVITDIFADNQDKRFAMGVFSGDTVVNKPNAITQGYLKLRANVYIDQIRVLKESARRQDGTERDNDDERSTHFVILENTIGGTAIFACMRLIEKSAQNNAVLPIETFFPDAFGDKLLPYKSIEVSRFISRHDSAVHQDDSKRKLMTTGLIHTLTNDLGPVHAIVEAGFDRELRSMKVPVRQMTGYRMIPEYHSKNFGIEIEKDIFQRRIGKHAVNTMEIPIDSFGYWGEVLEEDLLMQRTA